MRDFTIDIYRRLLEASFDAEYEFLTFEKFLVERTLPLKTIVMRHDVDRKSQNALVTAQIEKEQGIRASYYFRAKAKSYNESVIKKIVSMGHEIGYHYEDLALEKGDFNLAIKRFEGNLKKLRELYPVKTISMHGSPLSRCDNRKLWETYDYRDFGVMGEPYFDVDFTRVLYLTDTGRRWDGTKENVRDRVEFNPNLNIGIRTTYDLINALKNNRLPGQIMINIHPQRWHNAYLPWGRELVFQNTKNILKKIIVMRNERIQAHR
jgi:hypothetical protein